MERSSNKKIVRYVLIWFSFAVLWSVGLGMFAAYTEAVKRNEIAELILKYPEHEGEIIALFQNASEPASFTENPELRKLWELIEEKYGYDFAKSAFPASVMLLWGGVMLCVTVGLLVFICRENSRTKRLIAQNDKLYTQLISELENFKRGEFHLSQDFESQIDEQLLSDKWLQVRELLSELGFYFCDLKEQLYDEENNTKALITDISHQLKTPLASLRMNHELAMTDGLTKEEHQEFERQEMAEIENLEQLLDELVKLSRLEKDMISICPKPQEIRATIADAVSRVYGKAKGKQIEIQVDIPVNFCIVHDKKWTAEALANVLDNAVKYSEAQTGIYVRVCELTANLLIEIEDEGMGIPVEELHHIFKRFYRGTAASLGAVDGAGVGLYLARNIIELHGGTIMAKRKPEKGTIFRITLPLSS